MSPLSTAPPDAASRLFRSEEELASLPASERIRYRLVAAGCRTTPTTTSPRTSARARSPS
jgi:hypothetical protein